MAENYILLERIELNASAASVTFTNIPQSGYTDLKLVFSLRTTVSGTEDATIIQFNSSSTGYTEKILYATGSATGSATRTGNTGIQDIYANGATSTSNTFSTSELVIPNYTSANYKSMSFDSSTENNATLAYTFLGAGLWSNTAAITSIGITPATSSTYFIAGSTFSLYGLAAVGTTPAIAPKASGGNITTDGTYWYHTFLTSGTFTPATNLTCDALVVAGGGGGGRGGGGAGGLLGFTSQAFTGTTSYTVTVGAGGGGRTSDSGGLATQGSNSQLGSLTAAVGGGAGAGYSVNGGSGGSGGGAGWGGGAYNGGTATSGQGYAGGNGADSPAAGGGGAGGAGANGGGASGGGSNGNGGVGLSTYSSWGSATSTGQNVSGTYYYAGGGGGSGGNGPNGGSGGSGGGGTGSLNNGTGAASGTANTGGGGGGGWNTSPYSGTGGSGIVIIRYAMA